MSTSLGCKVGRSQSGVDSWWGVNWHLWYSQLISDKDSATSDGMVEILFRAEYFGDRLYLLYVSSHVINDFLFCSCFHSWFNGCNESGLSLRKIF